MDEDEFEATFVADPYMIALNWARLDYPEADLSETMKVAEVYRDFLICVEPDRKRYKDTLERVGNVIKAEFPPKE
jgi:accessory colonization factor AcfC